MLGLIWTHSGYSFHKGTTRIEELIEYVSKLGWKVIALTDLNGLYGSVWFWQLALDAGLKPILGAEIEDERGDKAVFLVKSNEGYKRLCKLLSQRHLERNFRLREVITDSLSGLVVLSAQENFLEFLSQIDELDLYVLTPPKELYRLKHFALKHNLKAVAGNSVYYLEREGREIHCLLRAIGLNQSLSRVNPAELATDPAWVPSQEEFKNWYKDFPEMLRELEELIEKCSLSKPPWGEVLLFDFEGMSKEQSFNLLCHKVWKGARRRYSEIKPLIKTRIDKELSLIRQKGYASYFLIIEDIVKRFPITCGRGSAAASIISYCLFITHIDPIRHNLLFERFISPGRKDPPDIDVDFPWDERDQVLDYVFEKYGPDQIAMVANHLSFQSRSSIREVARVFGIPEPEISRVTKRMSGFLELLAPEDQMKKNPLFRGIHFDPPWDKIIKLALKLEGLPYGLSTHCGGVVIADALKERVPIQTSAKGLNIIQWEKDQTEDAGLVKLDLLGNRSLSVIRDCLQKINMNYAELNPLDDPETKKLIAQGKTMGIFYIESPATRQLQEKTKVGDFEHIVIHSSIIRPAAHRLIKEYVKRLRGEKWEPIHPKLKEILSETYGIMVYQEDVMKVARELADFRIEEADELRRVLSKKHRAKKLSEFEQKFRKGAKSKGLNQEQIKQIWEMIISFQGYSFCKPHSASYALVSFKSGYLKAHHPAEFIASVISNQGGYYSTLAYISEAKRMGLEIKPPDINKSQFKYSAEDRALRVGLMQIKGLKKALAEKIIEERDKRGEYENLQEFLARTNPEPDQVRMLIKARCFDELEGINTRAGLFWLVNSWEKNKQKGQLNLYRSKVEMPKALKPISEKVILSQEQEALGFLISTHPLTLYQERLKNLPITPSSEFKNKIGENVLAVGFCITGKLTETHNGEIMEFISFEDQTGIYETILFPDTYIKSCHLIQINRAYLISGIISSDLDAISLQITNLKPLNPTNPLL